MSDRHRSGLPTNVGHMWIGQILIVGVSNDLAVKAKPRNPPCPSRAMRQPNGRGDIMPPPYICCMPHLIWQSSVRIYIKACDGCSCCPGYLESLQFRIKSMIEERISSHTRTKIRNAHIWVSCIPRRKTLPHMHWLQIATDRPYKNPDLVVKMASNTPTFSLSCWAGNSFERGEGMFAGGNVCQQRKGRGIDKGVMGK